MLDRNQQKFRLKNLGWPVAWDCQPVTFLRMHNTIVGSIKAFQRQIFWMQVLAATVQIVVDAMYGFVGRVWDRFVLSLLWSIFYNIYTFMGSIFEPCYSQNCVITKHVIKGLMFIYSAIKIWLYTLLTCLWDYSASYLSALTCIVEFTKQLEKRRKNVRLCRVFYHQQV